MKAIDYRTKLRIVWAVAMKDITDALRNKTILSTMFSMLLIIAMYQWGPTLLHGDDPPILALYDAGDSRLVALLEDSLDIEFIPVDSQTAMEKRLGYEQFPSLGIVLPPDFDERLRAGAETSIELSGYVDHWVTDEEAVELRAFFETLFSDLSGKPMRISITHDVYSQTDGGNPFTISLLLTVILTMLSISVMTHLMIEEQETRTMDALLVSPATPLLVLGGKIVAGMFYCLTATMVVLLMNQHLIIHWDVMLLASLSGAIFSAALGTLLGSTLKTKQQVSLWGFILLQPLILPVAFSMMEELFPEVVVTAMRWIPTVALAEVIRLSFVAQAPFSEVVWKLLLVIATAAVLMSIGVMLAKRERT